MFIEQLYEALKTQVLQTGYLHADETPIKVLDKDKKDKIYRCINAKLEKRTAEYSSTAGQGSCPKYRTRKWKYLLS